MAVGHGYLERGAPRLEKWKATEVSKNLILLLACPT